MSNLQSARTPACPSAGSFSRKLLAAVYVVVAGAVGTGVAVVGALWLAHRLGVWAWAVGAGFGALAAASGWGMQYARRRRAGTVSASIARCSPAPVDGASSCAACGWQYVPTARSSGDWPDHIDHAFGGHAFDAGLAPAVSEALVLAAAVLLAPLWILGIGDLLHQVL
jgi:hypothetical protein